VRFLDVQPVRVQRRLDGRQERNECLVRHGGGCLSV
jgi:hypothetical protein